MAEDWENLHHPSDGSAPIEGLKIRTGYACSVCGHRTTSHQIAKEHLKCGGLHQVHLQCWNVSGAPKFWIITPALRQMETAADTPFTSQAGSFFSDFLMIQGPLCKTSPLKTCCSENVNEWRKKSLIASSRMAAPISVFGMSSCNGLKHSMKRTLW